MANYPGQQPVLQFPSDPALNQEFVADNLVTYKWLGDRWSSEAGIVQKTSRFVIDGEYSSSTIDNTLDGGTA
jgi:hypothetical protein